MFSMETKKEFSLLELKGQYCSNIIINIKMSSNEINKGHR